MQITGACRVTYSTGRALKNINGLALAVGLLCVGSPSPASAQSVDSLTAALGSTSVAVRSNAVAALAMLPLSAIAPSTRNALIALLEREATGTQPVDPQPRSEDDETWGEYVIDLTDLVRTLGDRRSLRGLAMLGIETSRAAQEFVASFGSQALPPLDEAWATKPNARPSVITAWAIIARSADSTTRVAVLQRLLAPNDTFPIALADAAVAGNLTALVPLLDSLAQSGSFFPIVQGALREAADQLRPAFAAMPAPELLAQYNTVLAGICLNSAGALNGYCESTTNGLDNSTKHLLKDSGQHAQQAFGDQARQEIQQVIDRTLNAVANGVLSSTQGIALVAGLRQAMARIR